MAALVQLYPQQSSATTIIQTRNGSGPSMMPLQPMPLQPQPNKQYSGSQQQRSNNHHAMVGGVAGPVAYRGLSAPIQPYAFTSTPILNTNGQWQQQQHAYRSSSCSAVPTMHSFDNNVFGNSHQGANAFIPNLPYSAALKTASGESCDDSLLPAAETRTLSTASRPQSAYSSSPAGHLSATSTPPFRNQPDRYRRSPQRSTTEPGAPQPSGMVTASHLHQPPGIHSKERRPSLNLARPNSFYAKMSGSVDDMQLYKSQDDAKKIRRRSMPALDTADLPKISAWNLKRSEESPVQYSSASKGTNENEPSKSVRLLTINSPAGKARNASSESLVSSRSSNSQASSSANRIDGSNATAKSSDQTSSNPDSPKLVNIPFRSSSSDAAAKRIANPSPLSKPLTMQPEGASNGTASAAATPILPEPKSSGSNYDSPAVKHLAAINQKGGGKLKSKTSRLRRALSFGGAVDLRRAGASDETKETGAPTSLTKSQERQPHNQLDAVQARIAEQQEAAGIGSNIYAGSKLFSGSTDNLSISSTASSASIMIRKMGRGMKKGGRSLAGLFRPKSIIGVPTAESPETSQAIVSMVTVEAERDLLRVSAEPNAHSDGSTGLSGFQRNSLDVSNATESLTPERVGSSGTDNSNPRKSIVGGDKERAEVLAAVRKGILKHANGAPTAPARTVERNAPLDPSSVPHASDSPNSSAPSTPKDDANHKANGSVTIGNEDYFMTALRLRQDTKSAPGTPNGRGQLKRNATFNPRIMFYDTWPSQEYDRRSEIATCNRLTPVLAQQIKEELNNFKMEMEVHESSKIYTHFF